MRARIATKINGGLTDDLRATKEIERYRGYDDKVEARKLVTRTAADDGS